MTSPMNPRILRRKIKLLDADLPRHKELEADLAEGVGYGAWYSSQKEHWLGWLAEYDRPGAYGRVVGQQRSAALPPPDRGVEARPGAGTTSGPCKGAR